MAAIIESVEMHTGGEPVRIVTAGFPPVPGTTILDKRRYVRDQLDHLRTMLMLEPRGHDDMYGVIPVPPDAPGADLAVLFMHNEGYSTMCGHAVIAYGRYAVDQGLVAVQEPVTAFVLQCPCGPVRVMVEVAGGRAGAVRFESVPAFAPALDLEVTVPGWGETTVDVGYGGAFYAVVPAAAVGLRLPGSPLRALVDAASAVTSAVAATAPPRHPEDPDLGFLYGTILTDGQAGGAAPSLNVCVFADAQVDRSPTGSGVTARVAIAHRRGAAGLGEPARFASLTGAVFTGRAVREAAPVAGMPAVVVEVGGRAHYSGRAAFFAEPDDPLAAGFRLR